MPSWKAEDIFIAGRRIRIAAGANSQTVNVCTAENTLGSYEYKVRVRQPYVTAQELVQRRFGSVDQLIEYLVDERNGTVEQGVRRVAEPRLRSAFETWAARWIELATFTGPVLRDADRRIALALDLWQEPIPEPWMRGIDAQLARDRYRRGDVLAPHAGEHAIEGEILADPIERVTCFGGTLIDGVNAVPLSLDAGGGRRGNVEADLFLLVRDRSRYWLGVAEVKHSSNTAWYAAIENLRQLKLALASAEARVILQRRNPALTLPGTIPVLGLVIAPSDFFSHRGQKANSVPPTRLLLERFREQTKAQAYLGVWDATERTITAVG